GLVYSALLASYHAFASSSVTVTLLSSSFCMTWRLRMLRSMLRLSSSRVIPSRLSWACRSSSLVMLFSFLMPSITSLMYSGRSLMPRSTARWTSSRSSIASCRMCALLSRRNFSTCSGPMRAACTAAIWRASNSDWVTTSPFTLTMTRSLISPRAAAATRTTLMRVSALSGFMIHLGPGHEARDELLDPCVHLLPPEAGPDLVPALLERRLARRLPGVEAQDVEAERGLHRLADLPGREPEGRPVQFRRELAAREAAHEPARARFRRAGEGLGEGGEAARVLEQPAPHVPRLVHGRHQDLAEGDGLRALELAPVR